MEEDPCEDHDWDGKTSGRDSSFMQNVRDKGEGYLRRTIEEAVSCGIEEEEEEEEEEGGGGGGGKEGGEEEEEEEEEEGGGGGGGGGV